MLLNLAVFSYFFTVFFTIPRISPAFMIKDDSSQDSRAIRIFHLKSETFGIQIFFFQKITSLFIILLVIHNSSSKHDHCVTEFLLFQFDFESLDSFDTKLINFF